MKQYHYALMAEIESYAQRYQCDSLDTIYFGSGTPSTYPNALLHEAVSTIRRLFGIRTDAEITIEVNPGTVAPGQVSFWQSIGITRLSIGVQSLDDDVLKRLNRHQSSHDVFSLLESASTCDVSLSVDLIIG